MSSFENILQFGPKVGHIKLSNDESKELYGICLDSTDDFRQGLVGFILEEKNITAKFKTSKVYNKIKKYCNDYLKEVDPGYYKNIIEKENFDDIFDCTKAWYNKQVHMEHNPLHNHFRTADLVTVIYPKIILDEKDNDFIVNKTTNKKQTGQINFVYGTQNDLNGFGSTEICLDPQEGDLLIFPATLSHYTTPVLGDSVRYSISCNWSIHTHIKRFAHKEIK